jgi:hypothetical protein
MPVGRTLTQPRTPTPEGGTWSPYESAGLRPKKAEKAPQMPLEHPNLGRGYLDVSPVPEPGRCGLIFGAARPDGSGQQAP